MTQQQQVARTPASMDAAAVEAQNDLLNLDQESLAKVTAWTKKWSDSVGYKRIGRILVKE